MNHIHRITLIIHRMRNRKQPRIRGVAKRIIQVLRLYIRLEPRIPRVDLTYRLLEALLERAPDRHDLADRLHRGPDLAVHLRAELRQVPFRYFGHDVVERGLEACGGGFGDCVGQLGERVAECDFGGCVGEWVACCFGGECAVLFSK